MPGTPVPCLLTAAQLAERTAELAQRIAADYRGEKPVLVGVLIGAWVFLADLVRQLATPVDVDFVKLSSYGAGTTSSGKISLRLDVSLPLEGRHVLIVEDVLDTGLSMTWLLEHLKSKRPASIKLCALLDKPSRRQVPVHVDYLGFAIPDRFVVGYGIDYAEQHRELPYVGYLPEKEAASDVK